MQRRTAIAICALSIGTGLSLLVAGCAIHSPSRAAKRTDEKAARTEALKWLELIDGGDYEEAFEREPIRFRISITQKQFVRRV